MKVLKHIKCMLYGHDISGSKSIVETINSHNWIKKCNCCGMYIMHGDLGSICISEKEALKLKSEFDKTVELCKQYINKV